MKALQDSFNHAKQTYQAAAAQRSASWEEFNSLQPQLMQAVFGELQAMASAQARLMDAMRQEIGLPSDLDFMLKRVRATQSRMHEAADALVRGLGTD